VIGCDLHPTVIPLQQGRSGKGQNAFLGSLFRRVSDYASKHRIAQHDDRPGPQEHVIQAV